MGIWKKVKNRGRYRVLCDQDEMAHTSPHDHADTRRGAEAIRRDNLRRYRGLTFTIEERGADGFYRQVRRSK